VGSGTFEVPYSFHSRFESASGSNPEELLGAAHAGCFSMALTSALSRAGHEPVSVTTTAVVRLAKGEAGFAISGIELVTRGVVPGVSNEVFQQLATETKSTCIISRALAAIPMTLDAKLVSG
jgi:osmotically inducible protein OsmC